MGYKLALLGTVAVLIQTISSQCIGNPLNAGFNRQAGRGLSNGIPYGPNVGAGPFGPNLAGKAGPLGLPGCAASTGGSFPVTSASPVSPVGVSVLAENLAIEGPLTVGGNLPFLGTVGIEGTMPNAGVGSVSYGCGNGNVGIVSENAAGIPGPYGLAGSPITTAPVAGPYGFGSPVGPAVGSYAGAAVANAVSPYGMAGPLGPSSAIGGPYGLGGSPFGSSAGMAGSFGLAGSPIGPSGLGFGSGLGLNGFKGLRN